MKKSVSVICLLLAVVLLLSACDMSSNVKPAAEEMLTALSNGRVDDALALLHPILIEQMNEPETEIQQLVAALNGRQVTKIEQTYMYIGMKVDPSFTGKEERANFEITLDDGTVCQVQTVYYSGTSSGFVNFHIQFPYIPPTI